MTESYHENLFALWVFRPFFQYKVLWYNLGMSNDKKVAAALDYINDTITDFTDAVKAESPVNDVSQLMLATVETHLGVVRYLLLGEPEKSLGILGNWEIRRRTYITSIVQ